MRICNKTQKRRYPCTPLIKRIKHDCLLFYCLEGRVNVEDSLSYLAHLEIWFQASLRVKALLAIR